MRPMASSSGHRAWRHPMSCAVLLRSRRLHRMVALGCAATHCPVTLSHEHQPAGVLSRSEERVQLRSAGACLRRAATRGAPNQSHQSECAWLVTEGRHRSLLLGPWHRVRISSAVNSRRPAAAMESEAAPQPVGSSLRRHRTFHAALSTHTDCGAPACSAAPPAFVARTPAAPAPPNRFGRGPWTQTACPMGRCAPHAAVGPQPCQGRVLPSLRCWAPHGTVPGAPAATQRLPRPTPPPG